MIDPQHIGYIIGAMIVAVLAIVFWIGYTVGKERKDYADGLTVDIEKRYRTLKGGTRKATGWRWRARRNGKGAGFGTREFPTYKECRLHVVAVLNVDPKKITIKL